MGQKLTAPFPYYGGKRRWAAEVWRRFGQERRCVYVEPFAGSLAVLLANPAPCAREIVADTDGLLCNFWRGIARVPDGVAAHADYPTIHHDLTARHRWLVEWGREHAEQLISDPDWYDSRAAGWWVWGISNWIGGGWCHDHGFHRRPIIAKQGVMALRGNGLRSRFQLLADRLKNVICINMTWENLCTKPMLGRNPSDGNAMPVRVFLDPPYRTEQRTSVIYESDYHAKSSCDIADAAYEWAIEHGHDANVRIAYCCHSGDYPVPPGWDAVESIFASKKGGATPAT